MDLLPYLTGKQDGPAARDALLAVRRAVGHPPRRLEARRRQRRQRQAGAVQPGRRHRRAEGPRRDAAREGQGAADASTTPGTPSRPRRSPPGQPGARQEGRRKKAAAKKAAAQGGKSLTCPAEIGSQSAGPGSARRGASVPGRRPGRRPRRSAAAGPSPGTSGRSSPGPRSTGRVQRRGGTGSPVHDLAERLQTVVGPGTAAGRSAARRGWPPGA